MNETPSYTYFAPRDGSRYEQYFFRGRNLRAETLFRATIGPEPMTPEETAQDYNVPVDAVLEAIRYAVENAALLKRERDQDWDDSHARRSLGSPPLSSGA